MPEQAGSAHGQPMSTHHQLPREQWAHGNLPSRARNASLLFLLLCPTGAHPSGAAGAVSVRHKAGGSAAWKVEGSGVIEEEEGDVSLVRSHHDGAWSRHVLSYCMCTYGRKNIGSLPALCLLTCTDLRPSTCPLLHRATHSSEGSGRSVCPSSTLAGGWASRGVRGAAEFCQLT